MPLRLYRVATIGKGFIAIMARPEFGGGSPFADIAAEGVGHVVSLLEPGEARDLGLEAEPEMVRLQQMEFSSFPIPDMGVPASVERYARLTQALARQVHDGTSTLVHCRAGIGRSGLVAAGVLMHAGLTARQALAQISSQRGVRVPETSEQSEWLTDTFAAVLQARSNPDGNRGQQP